MARIRTIKPEFFKHEQLFDAEKSEGLPLRVAFSGLWCVADREGRFRWRPRALKLDILPYDELDFAEVMAALERHGFIQRYEVNGEIYGWIPSWQRHQSINQREAKSEFPAPEGAAHVHAYAEHDNARGEGKGKEGKGKEEDYAASRPNGKVAFQGKVIRLNEADYARWAEAYHTLDLRAELTALDDYYAENLKPGEKWFPRCSTALGNKHKALLAEQAKTGPPRSKRRPFEDLSDYTAENYPPQPPGGRHD